MGSKVPIEEDIAGKYLGVGARGAPSLTRPGLSSASNATWEEPANNLP